MKIYLGLLLTLLTFKAVLSAEGNATPNPVSGTVAEKPKCDMCQGGAISLTGISESKWLEPTQRAKAANVPFELTNQDGAAIPFNNLAGKPTAMTFLYTRCENPNKCPLAASTMAKLQTEVEKAGLGEQVQLAIMTYDPEFDTAAVLKKYAQERGIRCNSSVMMLRPDPKSKSKLFETMNIPVNYDAQRVNIHGLQLMLLDKSGRFVRNYQTLIWDNQKVLADLKKLLSESENQ